MIFVLLVSHFYTKVGNLKGEFMCPHPPGGGGGGELPRKKRHGMLVENFGKNPKEVPRSCFVGVA